MSFIFTVSFKDNTQWFTFLKTRMRMARGTSAELVPLQDLVLEDEVQQLHASSKLNQTKAVRDPSAHSRSYKSLFLPVIP